MGDSLLRGRHNLPTIVTMANRRVTTPTGAQLLPPGTLEWADSRGSLACPTLHMSPTVLEIGQNESFAGCRLSPTKWLKYPYYYDFKHCSNTAEHFFTSLTTLHRVFPHWYQDSWRDRVTNQARQFHETASSLAWINISLRGFRLTG